MRMFLKQWKRQLCSRRNTCGLNFWSIFQALTFTEGDRIPSIVETGSALLWMVSFLLLDVMLQMTCTCFSLLYTYYTSWIFQQNQLSGMSWMVHKPGSRK